MHEPNDERIGTQQKLNSINKPGIITLLFLSRTHINLLL